MHSMTIVRRKIVGKLAHRLLAMLLLLMTLGAIPAAALNVMNQDATMAANCPCCRAHGMHSMCSMRMHRELLEQQSSKPSINSPACHCGLSTPAVSSVVAIAVPAQLLTLPVPSVLARQLHTVDSYREHVQSLGHSRAPPLS